MLGEHQTLQDTYSKQTIILLIGVLFLVGTGIYHTYPPKPSSLSAPASVFSSARAMPHVQQIGAKSHPTGSLQNAYVRQYLVNQLKAIGLKPEIQSVLVVNPKKKHVGRIHNVLVRVPGTKPGKALLLSAHYDSVHTGPGAADDGASVAAILETLRAINAQPQLQNDLICLFTDSEETGLLGAEAFIRQHTWAKNIGLALNFEYRGNRGAFMMFETSQGNGKLIEGLAAAPLVSTTSLFYEVYKHLPNDTDFTVFKQAGIPGLNFAAIEGHTSYHTELDRPELLDQGSLQQEGDIMLALVKHFGNIPLNGLKSSDNVYFDFPILGLVHYPTGWIIPLNTMLLLIFTTIFTVRLKTKTVRGSRVVASAIVFPSILFGLAVASHFLWLTIRQLHPEYRSLLQGDTYNSHWYLLAFVFLNMGLFGFLQAYVCKWLRPIEFAFGAITCWLILLVLASVWLPGVSFLLFWPLAGMLVALGIMLVLRKNIQQPIHTLLIFLGSVPAILIFSPFISNLFIGLTPQMIGVVVVFLVLLLGLLTPLLEIVGQRKLVVGSSLLLSFAAMAAGSLSSGFDANHPRQNTLFYALSGTHQQAFWLSTDKQLDGWTSAYFPNIQAKKPMPGLFGDSFPPLWTAPAALLALQLPSIETLEDNLIADRSSDNRPDKRRLKIRVKSSRHAPKIKITIEGTNVLYSKVAGQFYSQSPRIHWSLDSVGLNDEGLVIELLVKPGIPFSIRAIDFSFGLPAIASMPRPASMISKPSEFSDITAVVKVLKL